MASEIKKVKLAVAHADELVKELNKLSGATIKYSTALSSFLKGNGQEPYWQGKAAKKWFDYAMAKLEKFCNFYETSYNKFDKYAKQVEKAEWNNAGNSPKTIDGWISQTADGWISEIKVKGSNIYNYNFKSYNAVDEDKATDMFTKEAQKCYKDIVAALAAMKSVYSDMNKTYQAIVNNTGGDIKKDAQGRINKIADRVSNVNNIETRLSADYVAEVAFTAVNAKTSRDE